MGQDNILILDADIDAAGILKEHLNSLGYFHVYLSTHTQIISDIFRSNNFDLLFMDVETLAPHRDPETCAVCAWFQNGKNISKVLMHWEYDDLAKTLMQRLAADHFLKKPYDPKALAAVFADK